MSKWKKWRKVRKGYDRAVQDIVDIDARRLQEDLSSSCGELTSLEGETSQSVTSSCSADVDDMVLQQKDNLERNSAPDSTPDGCNSADAVTGSSEILSPREKLACIAQKHNLTHASVKDLAAFCREEGIDVPRDPRTLMGTQRTTRINDVGFVHFGLEEGIRDALRKLPAPREVILQGNIDGLPLFKSSQVCFWPILCKVTNCGDSAPFIVSLFCGKGKPPCLESYLRPFLEEVQALTKDGLIFKGTNVPVTLSAMICDAPARSFVKRTIGHTGYYACELCTVRGVYMDGKVTYLHLTSPLRTDSSFRAQEDEHHHKGTSPFTCLDVDLVALFPTDYMHLVCLGVMRRLLRNWVSTGHTTRLGRQQRSRLDDSLRACAMNFPLQFQRRPRGTDELDRWKATEFRTFLLYVGPVVLRELLPDILYEHFLVLHTAIRILASPKLHIEFNDYAKDLLKYFVQQFGIIYGQNQLVYNVHTLSHLAEQCLKHGPLDDFSAFSFESCLGRLKKKLRSTSKPLAQISRRISEARSICHVEVGKVQRKVRKGDCFMLENSAVVVHEVFPSHFEGAIMSNKRDFFSVPVMSSLLGIWRVDGFTTSNKKWPLLHAKKSVQCLKLAYKTGHVIIPLLHLQ